MIFCTGTIVGLNVFMRFDFGTPEHYASLALSSGKDVGQAQWVISSAEGKKGLSV